MLQWTGGSRRKVATSRKSAHSRQKQYFEQRKRQRQAPGQEHRANGSDMEVLYKAEPRSLDILNMINLSVSSKPGLKQGVKPSNSYLPELSQTDSYKCADHMNKLKMPGSGPKHSSSCPVSTLNEINEEPQIESTILDLLDDGTFLNGRSLPEAHVALLAEGLEKLGSQTPAHSPRMQNRFSCKSTPMSSKASKWVGSSSDLEISYNDIDQDLNAMIGDFKLSPLSIKGGSWTYVGTCKSNVSPPPTYSHGDQFEGTSIMGKGFDACFLLPNEKYPNATSTPYVRHSTLKRQISPSFFCDSCIDAFSGHTNAKGNFDASAWSLFPAENYQDNTSPLSENSNASAAARMKSSLGFGACSVKPGKIKVKFSEFQKVSEDVGFMGLCSEDDIFDNAIWGEKQNIYSAFKMLGAENLFLLDQTFPSKTSSMLDPFNSFTPRNKSMVSCGYEAMTKDQFDQFVAPKTKFKTLSGCEPPGCFIYPHEISSKRSDFDPNSHVPIKSSLKTKGHVKYSSSGGSGFFKEIHFNHLPKYQEYNEERGSSGKPQWKDAENRPTSSGNAESAAGLESLDIVTEHDYSRKEIPEPSNSPGVEKLIDEAEVIPAMTEDRPTKIQNYVQINLNQLQGRASVSSHPSNEGIGSCP